MTEIKIYPDKVKKKIPNFYNNIHFHPTDAIEDDWGKRILSEIKSDNAVRFIRIYAMFEDLVVSNPDGTFTYDYSLNDKRMDLLVESGFKLIVTYCFMPVCLSSRPDAKIEKNRYKGKGYNSYEPSDYMKWQELCKEYTAHIVKRYGLETVSDWYFECWNEPDAQYWMKGEPSEIKISSYLKLYSHFSKGVKAISERLRTGGPAACGGLPESVEIVDALIKSISNGNKVDFISYHTYSISPQELNEGMSPDLMLNINKIRGVHDVLIKYGHGDVPIIIDEWESVWGGPTGIDEVPRLNYRNSCYFAAAYAKMIDLCINRLILKDIPLDMIMLCLSGQHDLKKDFEGKRNFITKNGFKKPIYNAYVLTNKLGDKLLDYDISNPDKNLGIIPTVDNGLKILVYYMTEDINEELDELEIGLNIPNADEGFKYKRCLIDGKTSNAFIQWKMTPENHQKVKNASNINVFHEKATSKTIKLTLNQNTVCLLEIYN